MDKKTFEKSLGRLAPECSRDSIQSWIAFAEECVKMGQYPDFILVSDKDAAVEKWLDAVYIGLCRAKQKYGIKPVEQICRLSIKHSLYPWEIMLAAEYLKNGGDMEKVALLSVEGMFDECDAKAFQKDSEQLEKEACSQNRGRSR